MDVFSDVHGVAAGVDPDPLAPRNKICRVCAAEALLYGLKEWWIRERQKGFLEESVLGRNDCPDGAACARQKILGEQNSSQKEYTLKLFDSACQRV